ncbi:MAG: DUF3078 domain-containing protein [Bacteroides sp.]|nr:DUF3078 domain-containing protein [Bacteroides sp.]MDE7441980.1 DUF3078 domain-containing protein [Muribaculaceae bacterium]
MKTTTLLTIILSSLLAIPTFGVGALTFNAPLPNAEIEEPIDSIRSVEEILAEIPLEKSRSDVNLFMIPRFFMGYRPTPRPGLQWHPDSVLSAQDFRALYLWEEPDSVDRVVYLPVAGEESPWDLADLPVQRPDSMIIREAVVKEQLSPIITGDVVPDWLKRESRLFDGQLDLIYMDVITNPSQRNVAFWTLPLPPSMPPEDYSYAAFLRRQKLNVNIESAVIEEVEIEKKHWLHVVNAAMQFSQAYLSKNWYQGGTDYLALLANFLWDVQLNPVYHPDMMFQSTLSYKLGMNATGNNDLHKYTISEDLFQYNIKFGYKAAHHWYYSFTGQFKTQFLNNYPSDSMVRSASFLTPGVLTLGVGMTYTKQNAKKTINFSASISPLSYNLKTAIDPQVDHLQFGMEQNERVLNEFGSSTEVNFSWKLLDNILYKTRLFLFTDYKDSNADWQNTLEFQFNRFFSTQLYLNLRYDSTADKTLDPKWNRWMMKEILSVGLSYTFSTKS